MYYDIFEGELGKLWGKFEFWGKAKFAEVSEQHLRFKDPLKAWSRTERNTNKYVEQIYREFPGHRPEFIWCFMLN